jgi:hypothetical protein
LHQVIWCSLFSKHSSLKKTVMNPMFAIQPLQPACHASCGAALRGLGHVQSLANAARFMGLASQRDWQHGDEKSILKICPEVEIV